MNLKEAQMLMRTLTMLVRAWSDYLSIEDILRDQFKLQLLLDAHESLAKEVAVPEEVREYYAEVFMRPVWG